MIQLSPYFLAKELSTAVERFVGNSEDAVCFTAPDGRLEWCNRSFSLLFGYTLEEAAGRRPHHFLAGAETAEDDRVHIEYQMIDVGEVYGHVLLYGKTGARLWVFLQLQPAFNDNRDLSHFVWVMRDRTEDLLANEEAAHLQHFIEKLSQQKATEG